MRVWLEPNDDSRKKLKFGWRLVELPGGHLAGIDTLVPNRIVAEALVAGHVQGLSGYRNIRREVPYGANSRVDFLLREPGLPDAYVEVKNVHLNRTGDLAEFPDCVTERGARHLAELSAVAAAGFRAVMLYVVQRTDCAGLALARDLDPGYGSAFDRACAAGVEVVCHGTRITLGGVEIASELPVLERVPGSA